MEGKWCEDRETATTATRSARGHRKVQRAMVQMPPQAPEGTCSALNLRLSPPEPRDQKRAVHASRLWCSVTAAPDSEQVGMGVTVWGKWAFQGLGGGPLGCSKTLSPNGHCPGLWPGPATSLLAAPPPTSRSLRAPPGQRPGLHLAALAGESGPSCGEWSGRRGPFVARAPGRRQQALR